MESYRASPGMQSPPSECGHEARGHEARGHQSEFSEPNFGRHGSSGDGRAPAQLSQVAGPVAKASSALTIPGTRAKFAKDKGSTVTPHFSRESLTRRDQTQPFCIRDGDTNCFLHRHGS
jgi:hypothetical protein